MTDLTADERKLLPYLTVLLLLNTARRRDQPSFWSFPDCHECSQPVDNVILQEKHFPTAFWIACKPCGHKTEMTKDLLRRLSKAAKEEADPLKSRSFLDAPDWLRGGVCCGCNGAGGPVVYRNCNDQPFCSHCCECDCRTIPCSKPEEPVLTAEEARAEVDRLNYELYQAQDALAYVAECCTIAEREQRPITTADVRTWLKGAQCGRQLLAEQEKFAHGPKEES